MTSPAEQVFDLIERLLAAAKHPDIAAVDRYGPDPQAVAVTYQSRAKAFLWPAHSRSTPAEWPETMPDYRYRAQHALRLVHDLLETARPEGVRWRPVSVEGVHLSPCALEVAAGGKTLLVRATSGGALDPDTDPASFAGWTIPDEVASCLRPVDAASATG